MIYYLLNNELNETSAVIRISGPDAYTYLQGQFSQDLSQPAPACSYGLWLNAKGRVLADSFVLRVASNEFVIFSPDAGATTLRQRLEAFLIADEVELMDETERWSRISILTDRDEGQLAKDFGPLPESGSWREDKGRFWFRGRSAGACTIEILCRREGAPEMMSGLAQIGAKPATVEQMESERIAAGVPRVPLDLGEGDLPAEGALDEVAISFTKGCYLGQEVIARLRNLGQVRRRLHVVRGSGRPPSPGTRLYQAGRACGDVRSAAPEGGGFVALAMLTLLQLDPAAGLALTPEGPAEMAILRRV